MAGLIVLESGLLARTWDVASIAAHASLQAYHCSSGSADAQHIVAQYLTSLTMLHDKRNMIVVAIRGSKFKFDDWRTNLTSMPASPTKFLDDEGNACHRGFLTVARSMVDVIFRHLCRLLHQTSGYSLPSLLFTGHSAGGAIASLLYCHMQATTVSSRLTSIARRFSGIHCITFGSPPISLLPLARPNQITETLFIAFVNDGDPVIRSDSKAYLGYVVRFKWNQFLGRLGLGSGSHVRRHWMTSSLASWLPQTRYCVSGQIVLLSESRGTREATNITESELRRLIFYDIRSHRMEEYRARVDAVAAMAAWGLP